MKIALISDSALLDRSLEIFLGEYLTSYKNADFIVATKAQESTKPVFLVGDYEDANLKKPFTREQLVNACEEFFIKIKREASMKNATNAPKEQDLSQKDSIEIESKIEPKPIFQNFQNSQDLQMPQMPSFMDDSIESNIKSSIESLANFSVNLNSINNENLKPNLELNLEPNANVNTAINSFTQGASEILDKINEIKNDNSFKDIESKSIEFMEQNLEQNSAQNITQMPQELIKEQEQNLQNNLGGLEKIVAQALQASLADFGANLGADLKANLNANLQELENKKAKNEELEAEINALFARYSRDLENIFRKHFAE